MKYAQAMDGTVRIMASSNTRALSAVDPSKQARVAKARKPIRKIILAKKWALTLYPTASYAQDAEMSLRDFENYVYRANMLTIRIRASVETPAKKQDQLIPDCAVQMRSECGSRHRPENVRERPHVHQFRGHAQRAQRRNFHRPDRGFRGRHVRTIIPCARRTGNGRHPARIPQAASRGSHCQKNQDYLKAMLDMDPGARRLGELGIGTNRRIQRSSRIYYSMKKSAARFTSRSASRTPRPGKKQIRVAWDMIKDLRKDGALYVDGKLFQKNGKFVGSF